ncbi:aminoacylase-1-like isoform X2 [Adelges cooleyi]|uniref:aminoacylase-1-like isoform X2 n=1 Tax=Adelges cooleyi TaxID=133065 RepID=UPI00217F5A0D|nr:aminoacylase-1-like isoform X2 [Adelges cooleyi]
MISSNNCIEHEAVTNFREYLRIPSVHPNIDYSKCVEFILRQAQSLSLPSNVYYMAPGKPIVIITWTGQKPELPSILLNSHMDVVPVYPDKWTYKPFSAHKDINGDIYARGAQDMKCIGIQYLEAIRKYRREKLVFNRTIHVSFVPDEEIGGFFGMRIFVKSPEFLALNVGFALDEGMPSTDNSFTLFYGERTCWHLFIKCMGTPGHGSLLHDNTAGEKLRYIIDKFMDWRDCEKLRLKNSDLGPGDVTSVNLTIIEGGCQINVVPPEFTVYFDVRLAVEVNCDIMENVIKQWCKEAGEGVILEFTEKGCHVEPTKLNDENLYWVALKNQFDKMNLKFKKSIFPGSTDSIFIREAFQQ